MEHSSSRRDSLAGCDYPPGTNQRWLNYRPKCHYFSDSRLLDECVSDFHRVHFAQTHPR